MKIDESNVMRFIECAIMFKADKCLKVMMELEGIDYS
jgi:hypothetical protein